MAVGVRTVQAGHRQYGRPHRVDGQVQGRHFSALGHDQRDPVASPDPERHEEVGVPLGQPDQLPVGPDIPAAVGPLNVEGDPATIMAPAIEDLRGDVHALGDVPLEAFGQRLVASETQQVGVEQPHERRILPVCRAGLSLAAGGLTNGPGPRSETRGGWSRCRSSGAGGRRAGSGSSTGWCTGATRP